MNECKKSLRKRNQTNKDILSTFKEASLKVFLYERRRINMLIIVSGYESVGKSTVAKALAQKLRAVWIDGPSTIEPLIEQMLDAKQLNGAGFRKEMQRRLESEKGMEVLRHFIADQVANGLDVIVELSTYYSDVHLAEQLQTSVHYIEVTMPIELEAAQYVACHPDEKDGLSSWKREAERRFPVFSDGALFERNIIITYDNSEPITEESIEEILREINEK